MAKFKVGDRVRIVWSGYSNHPSRMAGGTGTVTDTVGGYATVRVDGDPDSGEWSFDETDHLELIGPETAAQFEAATRDPLTILTACGIITQAQADAARALAGAL